MALDWSNERYVRLYRPSVDHRALCWQARAIWPLLLQEADGAGVIGARKGVAGLSKAIDFPIEVVEAGMADLIDDGCLVAIPGGYCIRNYVEAQTATMTDSSRKARQREVDRAVAALESAAGCSLQAGSQIGHAASREVTDGHGASRSVTPSRADPIRDPDLTHDARARDGQAHPDPVTDATAGSGGDLPGAPPPAPAATRDPDGPGALVMAAADRLTAARRAIDPQALTITEASARDVVARLVEAGPDARLRLDHALACVEARAKVTRTVDPLRWSSFASEAAWAYVQGASVEGYAAAPDPRSRAGPRDGQPRRQPPSAPRRIPTLGPNPHAKPATP